MKHPVVSESEWLIARRHHLLREKDLQRQLDELRQQRRELPWVQVTKPYAFTGANGQETLADLFGGSPAEFCPQNNLSSGLAKLLLALPPAAAGRNVLLAADDSLPDA